jgi:hypothetical protein
MGDRANVYVHHGEQPGVYLYTHWEGTELPATVVNALKRGKGRWNDDPYLTRIIFSEMIKDDVDGETGYGISAYVGDGDDRIVDVDTATQTVRFIGFPEFGMGTGWTPISVLTR